MLLPPILSINITRLFFIILDWFFFSASFKCFLYIKGDFINEIGLLISKVIFLIVDIHQKGKI